MGRFLRLNAMVGVCVAQVAMGNGNGEGIRGVAVFRMASGEENLNHCFHLIFVSLADSGQSFFDFVWFIFKQGYVIDCRH